MNGRVFLAGLLFTASGALTFTAVSLAVDDGGVALGASCPAVLPAPTTTIDNGNNGNGGGGGNNGQGGGNTTTTSSPGGGGGSTTTAPSRPSTTSSGTDATDP